MSCHYRFTTYEKEEELTFQVRKKDNRFEEFARSKLIKAITTACRKRNIPIEQIETLVASVEFKLREDGDRVIPSKKIGDLVMERLRQTDHVAYVRFASIYKDFKDPEEFMRELEALNPSTH
jgi:transcriptional repressor NrdR